MKQQMPIDPDKALEQNIDEQLSADDVSALESMIAQMNKATEIASNAVDDALLFVAESNKRIKKLEDN